MRYVVVRIGFLAIDTLMSARAGRFAPRASILNSIAQSFDLATVVREMCILVLRHRFRSAPVREVLVLFAER